jgi:phospholipid/cholesterol/gamma-HCH transport system substrate-binding protein
MNQETKLGLFVLAGIACLVVSIAMLGDFHFKITYNLNIIFTDVAGLPNKAKVKMAGVEVGGVKSISLIDDRAKVKIWLTPDVKLHTDAQAKIVSTGIIGSKYLELTPGSPAYPLLKDGDTIIGITPMSIEKIVEETIGQIGEVVKSLKGPAGSNIGADLASTVNNFKRISDSLRVAMVDKGNRVSDIVGNIDSFSQDIAEITSDTKQDLKSAIIEVRKVAQKLDSLLGNVDTKESMVGRLMTDKEMGSEFKDTIADLKETTKEAKKALRRINLFETSWDYTLRYDPSYGSPKSDVGLLIKPKPDKFYYVGVSNAGVTNAGNGPPAANADESQNTLNLLLGKNFGPAQIYGGVIRSEGGVGVKVAPFWGVNDTLKKFQLVAEGYDFERATPVNSPKLNLGVRYQVFPWMSVGSQVEDIYYTSNINSYVNFSVHDDDIAYLLGLVGLSSLSH